MIDTLDCHFAENGKWLPGKMLDFVPAGTGERNIIAVIAAKDGRLVATKLESIRHGAEVPKSLPAVHGFLPAGGRQHTIKPHNGRFIVASPDGVIRGEFDTEEEAKAKHATLEPGAAPASTAKPTEAKSPDAPALPPVTAKAG